MYDEKKKRNSDYSFSAFSLSHNRQPVMSKIDRIIFFSVHTSFAKRYDVSKGNKINWSVQFVAVLGFVVGWDQYDTSLGNISSSFFTYCLIPINILLTALLKQDVVSLSIVWYVSCCIAFQLLWSFFFIFEVFFISRHDNLSRCDCGGLLSVKSVLCVHPIRWKNTSDNRWCPADPCADPSCRDPWWRNPNATRDKQRSKSGFQKKS